MKENERTLRKLAATRLLSITPAHLRRHLLSAIGETTVNGAPSMFQCAVQDGKVVFCLDPAQSLGIDLAALGEMYRTGHLTRVRED